MSRKVAINGFGRIGRMVFRILEEDPELEVVAINDLTDVETLAYLLEYDSVHRRFNKPVTVEAGALVVGDRRVHTTSLRNPADLPWGELGVELVLECTGIFRSKEKAQAHVDAGAKLVLISAPAKGGTIDRTIVVGVNDDALNPEVDQFVSNGSCTTN